MWLARYLPGLDVDVDQLTPEAVRVLVGAGRKLLDAERDERVAFLEVLVKASAGGRIR